MRILVEVPTYDGRIAPCTSESLWRLDRCGHEVDYRPRAGYGVGMARNRMAADAINARYDRLLMVDNDIALPADALEHLMEHDAPVVMGWYLNRYARGERRFTTIYRDAPGWHMWPADELIALRDAGTNEVDVKGGGMGCCLIDPRILDGLPFPWFEWCDIAREPQRRSSAYECTDAFTSGGEDINFCNKVRAAGIRIVADTRVACGHEFREVIWPQG